MPPLDSISCADDLDAVIRGDTHGALLADMALDHVPDLRALGALVHAGPAGDDVGLLGVDRLARPEQHHVADPAALRLVDVDPVAHAAYAHHVAALLVIGVGVEDIVGHVLEDHLDEFAGHLAAIGLAIGHRGDVPDILADDVVPGDQARAPPDAGAHGDIGLALTQ